MDRKRINKNIRNSWWNTIVYLVILVMFGWLLYERRHQLGSIFLVIDDISWWYLLAGFLVQVTIIFVQSFLYCSIYSLFGLRMNWLRFAPVLLKSVFTSVVAPSGGFLIGIGVILNDGIKKGFSKGKLVVSNVSYWVVYYTVFLFFLIVGLSFLVVKNQATDYIMIPALVLFIAAGVFLGGILLFLNDYEIFKKYVVKIVLLFNKINRKFGRDSHFDVRSAKKYSYEIFEGYHGVIGNLFRIRRSIVAACSMIFLNIILLGLMVAAFGGDWQSWGVLLSTVVVAMLLMVVSLTPSGLGVVELSMTTIINAFLLPLDQSMMVVLLYRLFQFWLPVLVGFYFYRKIKN